MLVTVLAVIYVDFRYYINGVILLSGPGCRHRHVRRVMCVNYLTGFCPEGPRCKFKQSVNSVHMLGYYCTLSLNVCSPKFDIPMNAPFIDSARYQLVAGQV